MEQYVGLDVSLKLTAVCVIDSSGERVWQGKCGSAPDEIEGVIRKRAPYAVRIALETGPLRELRERGFDGGYTILTDWLRPQRKAAGAVAVRRFETAPGEQAQVDWGHLGHIEIDGVEHKLWAFAFTLGYSRMMVAEAALDQKLGTLLRMHEEAFRQLNGVPREILPDYVPGHIIGIMCPTPLCGQQPYGAFG